jgi:23S rRNA pseudouridine2604 synthase
MMAACVFPSIAAFMSRPILKIAKRTAPTGAPKAMTSRAKRALHGKKVRPPQGVLATAGAADNADAAPAPGALVSDARDAASGADRARAAPITQAPGASPAKTRRRRRTSDAPAPRASSTAAAASRDRSAVAASGGTQRSDATPAFQRPHERRRGGAPGMPRDANPAPAPRKGSSAPRARSPTKRAGAAASTPRVPAATPRVPAVTSRGAAHERPDHPRLSKRMSELGLCSRREADEWIENGWVKVDGVVIDTLGTRVAPQARIDIDRAAAKHQSEQVTILLNKPIGYVSGQAEHGYEPASVLIRPENRWPDDPSPMQFKPSHLRGLAPAGRLDIDSTGLLVFTQDGRVAKRLVGRDSDVEKEYLVRVEGTLSKENLERLRHGLELDGVKLRPAKVSWQNEDQLRFVLREGRKRQIRRMCELVGLAVVGLKRVRSGGVPLGPLPVGQWRYLRRNESF